MFNTLFLLGGEAAAFAAPSEGDIRPPFFGVGEGGGFAPLAGRSPGSAAIKRRRRPARAGRYRWLIILARYPAPKPLSMFTTLTPLAQELSMDSRAARPPKAAP